MLAANIILSNILKTGIEKGATDIHLIAGSKLMGRINGRLNVLDESSNSLNKEEIEKMIYSFLNENEKEKLEKEREITIVRDLAPHLRFKINAFYQKGCLSASFRFIPESIKPFTQLGYSDELTKKLVNINDGLIVIAGPYGSGRTTTLSSLIEEINNNRQARIITIENPIEFIFTNKKSIIEQREINTDVPNYLDALKYCQRQNIDVLAITGNVEEKQVVNLIMEIATGASLVIWEMNADSAIRVIEKIISTFEATKQNAIRSLLSNIIQAIVVQKLLPKIGGGEILAKEILFPTPSVQSIIREGRINQIKTILQTSKQEGMISFERSLADLVEKRLVELKDALAQVSDKEGFKAMIK